MVHGFAELTGLNPYTMTEAEDEGAKEPPMDLVTLLQKKVRNCRTWFAELQINWIVSAPLCVQIMDQANTCLHFCGALQQRAPAQQSILDNLMHPVQEDPEWQQVIEMPKVLHSQMEEIQALLDKLPQPCDHVRFCFDLLLWAPFSN